MARNSPVSAAVQRFSKLTTEQSELQKQRAAKENELRAIQSGIASERKTNALDSAAIDFRANGVLSMDSVPDLGEQNAIVESQLRVINRAVQMNERDRRETAAAVVREATEAAKPEYVGIVSEVKQRIIALQFALTKEADFRNKLETAGGSFGCGVLQAMNFDAGQFNGWLSDAASFYGV
ncbi:MAG TPA: hypothetical protein VGI40_18060 [Pirellulaceae bacterium]|jgi:hypothetical protein